MSGTTLPPPDRNGIRRALPQALSAENQRRLKKFGTFMFLYEFMQDRFVRPRLHKADPVQHRIILRRQLRELENSRILDLGCGTGAAIPFIGRSNEYTGLDLSYPMLKQAVKKAAKRGFRAYEFIQGDAEKLLMEGESFDMVLMDTALHMIPRYQSALEEAARVLTRDGVFLCSTPATGILQEFDDTWAKISDKRDLNSFSEDDLKAACSRAGLDFHRIDQNGGVLYFQAQKRS
jgi:malonyl-CoA O-methyltransferase